LRVIDVLTQAMVSREMQGAITQDGVVIDDPTPEPKAKPSTDPAVVPEMPEPPKPRPRRLNPMVEHQAKCWDRLRKATDTFEKSFGAAQEAANKPGRWTEILQKTKGVMDDALAYEKKRLAKLKKQGKLPPPGPGDPIPPELVGKAGPFGPIPPAILKLDELEAKAAAGDLEAQKELDEMPWPPI
ncbi:MAG: hypothetical protein GY851_00720, partial [bacterium]|nr:hypothetical protein [bacterium]